jgi:hypothetical protein
MSSHIVIQIPKALVCSSDSLRFSLRFVDDADMVNAFVCDCRAKHAELREPEPARPVSPIFYLKEEEIETAAPSPLLLPANPKAKRVYSKCNHGATSKKACSECKKEKKEKKDKKDTTACDETAPAATRTLDVEA